MQHCFGVAAPLEVWATGINVAIGAHELPMADGTQGISATAHPVDNAQFDIAAQLDMSALP